MEKKYMNIKEAIDCLEKGKHVTVGDMYPRDHYIFKTNDMWNAYMLHKHNGEIITWSPSQDEIRSNNWTVVQ